MQVKKNCVKRFFSIVLSVILLFCFSGCATFMGGFVLGTSLTGLIALAAGSVKHTDQAKAQDETEEEPEITVSEYIATAKKALNNGEMGLASGILARALEDWPDDYTLNTMQGDCLTALGKHWLAKKHYMNARSISTGAIKQKPVNNYGDKDTVTAAEPSSTPAAQPSPTPAEKKYKDPDYYAGEAERLIKNTNFNKASKILQEGLEGYPMDFDMNLMHGYCMIKLGKKEAALKNYTAALESDPENKSLKTSVENLTREINSSAYKKQKRKEQPQKPAYYSSKAELLIKTGDIAGASRKLSDGLKLYPSNYRLNCMQGYCLSELGRKKEAYACYKKALEMDPGNKELQQSVSALRNDM